MGNRKILFWLLFLLAFINLILFFFRDRFQYQLYSTYSQLYDTCGEDCRKKWSRFAAAYEHREFEKARKILRDSFQFSSATPVEEKILSISRMIMSIFTKRHGFPSAGFLRQSPLQQYENLCLRDSGHLWCGNVAQIFAFFCFAEGILCRNIEIRNPGDHHVVNECYLPQKKQWVLIDVPHGLVLVKDSAGRLLDLQTFRNTVTDHQPVWVIRPQAEDKLEEVDIKKMYYHHFYLDNHPHFYYYELNDEKIYTSGNKLRRYFFADPWYEVYSVDPPSNWKFYLKQVVMILFILTLLVAVLDWLRKKAV